MPCHPPELKELFVEKSLAMPDAKLKVFRGNSRDGGTYETYTVPIEAGMVVLDAIHYIQQNHAPDIAVRWNCKAAKCGSCSAESERQTRSDV